MRYLSFEVFIANTKMLLENSKGTHYKCSMKCHHDVIVSNGPLNNPYVAI